MAKRKAGGSPAPKASPPKPKCLGGAQPKAKGKAAAATTPAAHSSKAASSALVSSSDAAQERARKLRRNPTDEAAARVIAKKFAHIPEDTLKTTTDSNERVLRERIRDDIRAHRGASSSCSTSYLPRNYAEKLHAEFFPGLQGQCPVPDRGSSIQ